MKKLVILAILFLVFSLPGFSNKQAKKKYQLELFGGYSLVNPGDLNAVIDFREQYMNFWYVDSYEYYSRVGYFHSLSQDRELDYRRIKNAFPFGIRLKYYFNKAMAFSVGVQYISNRKDSNAFYHVAFSENDGTRQDYTWKYAPISISARGIIPSLGIHLEKRLSDTLGFEVFASGGPLFSNVSYNYDYVIEHSSNGNLISTRRILLEEKGKGTGYSFDGGIRMNVALGNRLGLFVEGGYAFRWMSKPEGPGQTVDNGETDSWRGEWGMKEYYAAEYWGVHELEYPSNHWDPEEFTYRLRNFKLDLSGFQVRIGLSYRF
jgi:hypothetical protein